MLILIYGKGWIGSQFADYLTQKGVNYLFGESRVDNQDAVIKELDAKSPTHVVAMIGRTHGTYNGVQYNTIDYLEQPGMLNENIRDNLYSPLLLALICQNKNIHFTYLGTGCIFSYDGTNDEIGFSEEDLPNFTGSSYSTVKGYTDRLMHNLNILNLRIRMPITDTDNGRNFISKIIRYEKICSIPNSMTVLADFFPIWLDLLIKNKIGTYNCTNPGVISHNEILTMYKKYVDQNFEWRNFTIEEQNEILYSKRSNNRLNVDKIKEYNIPTITQSVEECLRRWHKP